MVVDKGNLGDLDLAHAHSDRVPSSEPEEIPAWLHAVPFGLMVVGRRGVIEHANEAAARLLGYTPAELAGSTVERLIPAHLTARHVKLRTDWVGQARSTPMSRLRTVQARTKDGSLVGVHIELSRPWPRAAWRTLVTLRDMRPQLAVEAQLHRLQRMENLGLLAAGSVHDFNNHLNTLELLCALRPDDPDAWQDIGETTRQLRQLVDSLRRISRSEDGPVAELDVGALLVDHRGVFDRITEGVLRLELRHQGVWMRGRATDVVQSLVNLLINAVHAQREARVGTPITLALDATEDGYLHLSVEDGGVGMTTEQISRACQPGVTSRGHRGGSGLGLAIVQSVVEAHGGTLLLTSERGHGTTIRMSFPRILMGMVDR